MKNPNIDRNAYSYQVCMESFNAMAADQPVSDRYGYRDAAMEAMTGPDAGMVIEKLYKGITARSGINFGKIPDSMGDLTAFSKYKSIDETFILLDRDLASFKVDELKMAHELHDNLIRLRDDFQWGFKTDSQFLKTTYNSMVYALCELLNLCTVVYIDALKASVEQTKFVYVPYKDLLLVQNVSKFNKMVTTGEWAQMTNQIRKGAKNLNGTYDTHEMAGIAGILSSIGVFGMGISQLAKSTQGDKAKATTLIKDTVKNLPSNTGNVVRNMWNGLGVTAMSKDAVKQHLAADPKNIPNTGAKIGGKAAVIIMGIIAAILIMRALINIFWKATYSLRDIFQDNEALLAANMACANDNTATSLEKQQKMYNALKGVREKIESAILSDDKKGKKNLKDANASELTKADVTSIASGEASGFTFG